MFGAHALSRFGTKKDEARLEHAMLISYIIVYDMHLMILNPDEISNPPHHLCFRRLILGDSLFFLIIFVTDNVTFMLRISGGASGNISRFLYNGSIQYEGVIFDPLVTVLVVRHHLIRGERVRDDG